MNPEENPPANPTPPVPTTSVAAAPTAQSVSTEPYEPIELQNHRYGGFIRRFIATQIDALIVFIVIYAVTAILALLSQAAGSDSPMPTIIDLLQVVFIIAGPAYTIYFLHKNGATPGKKILHLKVISTTKEPLSVGRLFLREVVGKFLSGFFGSLGYFWYLFDEHRQAWHDKIGHTVVIDTREITPEAYSTWRSKERSALPPFIFLSAVTPLFFLSIVLFLYMNSLFQELVVKSFPLANTLLYILMAVFTVHLIVAIAVGIYLLKEQRFSPFLQGKSTKIGVGVYIFFQIFISIVVLGTFVTVAIYGLMNYRGPVNIDTLPYSSQTKFNDLEQAYPDLQRPSLNSR